MRLHLIPVSTRRNLIYCQRLNQQLSDKQTFIEKITARAGNTWAKWERAEKGWQKKVSGLGNSLLARIPYEEWGLKSVPPLSARKKTEGLQDKDAVTLLYPDSVVQSETALETLKGLATEHQAFHRKWIWGNIALMPLTIPFGLIPIAPNLPFFYLVFRAWSHWRALSGSKHLEFLLKNDLIRTKSSELLSSIYDLGRTERTQTQSPLKDSVAQARTRFLPDVSSRKAFHSQEEELKWLITQEQESCDFLDVLSKEVDNITHAHISTRIKLEQNHSANEIDLTEDLLLAKGISNKTQDQAERAKILDVIFQSTLIPRSEEIDNLLRGFEQEVAALAGTGSGNKSAKSKVKHSVSEVGKELTYLVKAIDILKTRFEKIPVSEIVRSPSNEQLLLTNEDAQLIAYLSKMPELEVEIERATAQVRKKLTAEAKLEAEKMEQLKSATAR